MIENISKQALNTLDRMKKLKLFACIIVSMAVMMYSCSPEPDPIPDPEIENPEEPEIPEIPEDPGDEDDDDLNPNSQNVTFENAIGIAFSKSSGITVTNPFEGQGVTIVNNDGHIVITSTITDKELNYVLSGITDDGSVKIYGEYKFGLVLNGTGITNPRGAAINIQCGKKVTVNVVGLTNNRLIDGETYEYTEGEDMKGTFFSEGQLNFYGNGKLEVRGKNKHAICTDDYFRMYEGDIQVKEAVSDAVHSNDYIRIDGGSIVTRSAGDGFDTDGYVEIYGGTVNITTTDKKGHGIKSKESTKIHNGEVGITVYGVASKGVNATGDTAIYGGNITINTAGDAYYDIDDADTSSSAGIKCDGNFLMENGNVTLLSTGSGGKGINVEGTLTINDGTLNVTTTGDQFVHDANNDTAAKAVKSDGDLTVNGGTIVIRTSKTEAEGLESKATLTINGGNLDIEAYDDGINASNHIEITGGTIWCSSQSNDALDSNGTLSISGGVMVMAGASSPEAGFDCDQSRFSITGGTIIGIGGDTSSPTASASTQRSVVFRSSSSNIQVVRIENTSDGKEVLTFEMPKTYSQRMTMLFSSAGLEGDTGYTIYTGGTISGGSDFHGLYTGADYTKGTSAGTFTTGSAAGSVSTVGTGGGPGPR